jgi:hypothetical protein
MKRPRDYEEIVRDYARVSKESSVLFSEMYEHPEYKKRQKQETLLKLQGQLPPVLIPILMDEEKLTALSVDRELEDDSHGEPAAFWKFSCTFEENDTYDYCVLMGDASQNEFNEIDFHRDPLRLWQRALDENEDILSEALAAFCYACCEHMGDWSADPTRAFVIPKNKKEVQ